LLPDQKVRAREDVGELLFLMAAIEGLKNDAVGQSSSQGEHLAQAFDLNRRSEECYPANEAPGALWQQRAVFAERASKYDESRECLLKATARPPKTTRDYGMAACMLTSQWRFGAALPLWQQASSSDPQNVWAWYGLGHCYDQLSQPARAAACYTACIALKPDYYGWYFKRGLNYLKQKDYSLALADLDETLKLRPGAAEARFNRAVVLLNLNRCPEAIANLEDLVGQGHDDARTRLLLAQAKEKAGDPEGARRERIAGLQRKPIDDNAWVAQAIARSKVDPVGAVKDLDRALDYNAFSAAALESKANLFAERLGRTEDAVAVLDRAVAIYPENASLLAARGVLLARLGRNAPARHDAQAALSLAALSMDQLAATSYQVAGIYALLSRTESADLDRAIELLAAALRSGYGEDLIAADKDLDPLRKQAKFQQLLQALHTLHPTSADSRANNTRQTAND
jgi:tetratricopeptide (TPR) repeat protein